MLRPTSASRRRPSPSCDGVATRRHTSRWDGESYMSATSSTPGSLKGKDSRPPTPALGVRDDSPALSNRHSPSKHSIRSLTSHPWCGRCRLEGRLQGFLREFRRSLLRTTDKELACNVGL